MRCYERRKNSGQHFDEWITHRNVLATSCASSFEKQVTDERYILITLDRGPARTAPGPGGNQIEGFGNFSCGSPRRFRTHRSVAFGQHFPALLFPVPLQHDGYPVYHDIQETADDEPEKADDDRQQHRIRTENRIDRIDRSSPSDGCLEINQVTVPQAHCLRGATKAKIGSRRLISFLNDGAHLEDRQIHRDHQAADEHTEDGHDQRFQQGAHVVDRVVHIFFEEVCDLTRHFIQ